MTPSVRSSSRMRGAVRCLASLASEPVSAESMTSSLGQLSSAGMTAHDGNGWTRCGLGHRHWGRHGAAGLLLAAPDSAGRPSVLLQRRSRWGSHGGTWGLPGGARDSHESAECAALREAAEECAIDTAEIAVHGLWDDDHGGWAYQTVLASVAAPLEAAAASEETSQVAWVPEARVDRLRLHPGVASQWPALRGALAPPLVVVDAANVIGSRPDGWWRDRAGAAARLCQQVAVLAARGIPALPEPAGLPALSWWFPRFAVVLEGAAAATGSGDDEIVRQVRSSGDGTLAGPVIVVTADRELRSRCQEAGAAVTGPRWLLGLPAGAGGAPGPMPRGESRHGVSRARR